MTLPVLAGVYELQPELISAFRGDGHVLLRNVATRDEIAAYRAVIMDARERYGAERTPLDQRTTYGKAFLKGMNLWEHDEATRGFVLSPRFGRIAAELMGVSGVRVYHDQALIKEPGGGITPWHQDQHYWPIATDNMVTMWMPLVDISPEMGVMRFASGSHVRRYLGDRPISDDSEREFDEYVREQGFRITAGVAMSAGDATFHYGWTLHGAPANMTNENREVMTVIWYEDGARVAEPDNANRVRDLERWLPGLRPGDVAASALTPLVWSA
jgi:ectoine hydroxylase-related dioxygenase (phytanoyl-CoA dioxygenase family)